MTNWSFRDYMFSGVFFCTLLISEWDFEQVSSTVATQLMNSIEYSNRLSNISGHLSQVHLSLSIVEFGYFEEIFFCLNFIRTFFCLNFIRTFFCYWNFFEYFSGKDSIYLWMKRLEWDTETVSLYWSNLVDCYFHK